MEVYISNYQSDPDVICGGSTIVHGTEKLVDFILSNELKYESRNDALWFRTKNYRWFRFQHVGDGVWLLVTKDGTPCQRLAKKLGVKTCYIY